MLPVDAPKKYIKIPREVEAMLIIDYTSMKKAVKWVESFGGFARITSMKTFGEEKLVVETSTGLTIIPRQYYLIRGDMGGFYTYPSEIFVNEYEAQETSVD